MHILDCPSRRSLRLFVAAALLLWPAAGITQTVAEQIEPGIVRYHASISARDQALPSLCLAEPLKPSGPATTDGPLAPVFQRIQGRASAHVPTPEEFDLYGTGEVPGPLRRNGTRTVAWNFDAYGWNGHSQSLYQSHPWVLAVRPDGRSFGVLADTPERCLIDLRRGIRFIADGPEFPVIIVEGDTPQDVVRSLARLTGLMPLPPKWSLGYHQSRYSYTPDDRVRDIGREFRERDIPCDVIWLDIDYMDGFRSFTFNHFDFPEPRALLGELHDQGYHTVAIIDPGIKQEDGYHVYDSGSGIDAWVTARNGSPFVGSVWPGACVFPDFTREQVRLWWGGLYARFLSLGIDGVWNDMNEPAVFHVEGKTMPLDNRHRADPELGGPGDHARYHNVYGMLMARATFEGCLRVRPDRRPFVLSRANHLGGQRYAACWTGDNSANWNHVDWSVSMVLNLGLSGQPLSGPDIGGYSGAGSGKMFARWMGIGSLLPFARGHTAKGNIEKEPWSFGHDVEQTCRLALQRRYRLLPYLYTLMREASQTGLPLARPLFFADPVDPRLRDQDDSFLLGDDLLVVCGTKPDGLRTPVFPAGDWMKISLIPGDLEDPDLPDLYLRSGAALPLGPIMEYSGEKPLDELVLIVNPDADGQATAVLYEDAGDGFGYRDGQFRVTKWTVTGAGAGAVIEPEVIDGEWPELERPVSLIFGLTH
jgi:alpha-glucosidase